MLHFASKGSQQDVTRLSTIISQAKAIKQKDNAVQREAYKSKPSKPPSLKETRKLQSIRFQEATHRRHPDTPSIFLRPRLCVSGKRRIPVLVNARGVPFLRIKKPQPRNLSGVIRNKLERRWHRIEVRDRLQSELRFAMDEDVWDDLTNAAETCTWVEALNTSLNDVEAKIQESDRINQERSEKLWNIVLQEQELAAKEMEEPERDGSHLSLLSPHF